MAQPELPVPETMFGTTKIGRVLIAIEAIKEDPDMVYAIMAKMIPIKTIISKEGGLIEYVAISEEFDALKSTEMIPEYVNQIHSDGSVTFVRKTFKRSIPDSVKDEIMRTIMSHKVDMDAFKSFVLQFNAATAEDFETYDESFLEALLIYIARRDKNVSL